MKLFQKIIKDQPPSLYRILTQNIYHSNRKDEIIVKLVELTNLVIWFWQEESIYTLF